VMNFSGDDGRFGVRCRATTNSRAEVSCMIADTLHLDGSEEFFQRHCRFRFVMGERMIPTVLSTGVSRLKEG
jgi:hypothetical protein